MGYLARSIRESRTQQRLERVEEMVLRVGTLLGAYEGVSFYVLDGKLFSVGPSHADFVEPGDYFEFCAEYRSDDLTLPSRRPS